MLERLLIAMVLVALGVGLAVVWQWRQRRLGARGLPGLVETQAGRPTVVYFTLPQCGPCLALQRPALAQLQAELGEGVQVVTIDASEQPEVAKAWGVVSVPTTFVLDRAGQTVAVNNGVALVEKLRGQLGQ